MRIRDEQLAALAACVDEGSFDGAAAVLRVTPSAVSQRIKALEQQVGRLVLVRSNPVRPTEVGAVLLRSARQRALLDVQLRRELRGDAERDVMDLPVAVNADTLATWFTEVLATAADWGDVRLRLFVEDQDHSLRLLREGSVLGAVTSSSAAVQGCSVHPLGVMRYLPRVSSALWERVGDVAALPVVRFNDHDDLQRRVLRENGLQVPTVEHVVPSAEGFVAAVAAGLGWGMVPEGLEHPDLVPVPGLDPLDVELFWQCWRLQAPGLERLSNEVQEAAHSLR